MVSNYDVGEKPRKRCAKCGELKPLADFYRTSQNRDGRASYCKDCTKAYNREHRHRHVESYRARERGYYYKHLGKRKAYSRRYYRAHQAEREAYARTHPEVNKAASCKYRQTEKGKRTAVRARHARRTRIAVAESDVTEEGMLKLLAAYEVCPYCGGTFEEGGGLSWDHVVPLSKGGQHTLRNLLPVCLKCNVTKGARLLSELFRVPA